MGWVWRWLVWRSSRLNNQDIQMKVKVSSLFAGNGPEFLGGGGEERTVLDGLLVGLGVERDVADVGLGRNLLQDLIIVLAGHEFIHELIAALDDLIDFLYLLLLGLLVVDPLVLAVLLDSLDRAAEGTVGRALLDRRLVQGEHGGFETVGVGQVLVADAHFLAFLLPADALVESVEFDVVEGPLVVVEVAEDVRESLLIPLEEDGDGEEEALAVAVDEGLQHLVEFLLDEDLAALAESGCLREDLPHCDQVVLLGDFLALLIKIVYIFLALDQPVLDFDFLVLSDEDVAGTDCAVDLPLGVEEGDAFEDGDERIEDFFLGVVDDLVGLLPVFEFYLERGESLGVEQPVVVHDGADQRGVREVRRWVCLALALEVLVGLLARLVQQQDVPRLEFYYAELLAYCSLRHPLRIYFVYYIFHQFLFNLNAQPRPSPVPPPPQPHPPPQPPSPTAPTFQQPRQREREIYGRF